MSDPRGVDRPSPPTVPTPATPAVDRGSQVERTALAWRRTTLALAAGALVSLRVLPGVLGLWSFGAGILGLALAGLLWLLSGRRHRRIRAAFAAAGDRLRAPSLELALVPQLRMPGAGVLLLLALVASGGGALGLLYVVLLPR
jgi:uncharacterized membrane protein YidH (DUF202 family)